MNGLIYTSLKETNEIVSWNKMHRVKAFKGHKHSIIRFLVTGQFIFSLAEQGEFVIFNTQTAEATVFDLGKEFSLMIHPVTYINKLLFSGGNAGNSIQLWNIIE
jgi:hypothetical protein